MPSLSSGDISAKRNGVYYTPKHVATALVQHVVRHASDQLLDPSCGDGRFLAHHSNSVGVERDKSAVALASRNAPNAELFNSEFFDWARKTQRRFDCACGNPPFIRYQDFAGLERKRALEGCERLGVKLSGLTASWAPFLIVTAGLLKKGGRMAFVVPSSIGHASQAAPTLDFLLQNFCELSIVAIRRKIFPELSEDCWLLFANGFGSSSNEIRFTQLERFEDWLMFPPKYESIAVQEWRTAWNRRLRPYLLSNDERTIYLDIAKSANSPRFRDMGSIGNGYVTGDNKFFHLRRSDAMRLQIPRSYLQPTVRNSRVLPNQLLTKRTLDRWWEQDEPAFLLRVQTDSELPREVRSYLNSPSGKSARLSYKCRHRTPWYVVPDVRVPHYFLSYLAGDTPRLVKNAAGAACTNSIHAIQLRKDKHLVDLLSRWHSSFVKLSCEIEGHPLGGGLLKLEPKEAGRIILPAPETVSPSLQQHLSHAIGTLRRWRHYEQ